MEPNTEKRLNIIDCEKIESNLRNNFPKVGEVCYKWDGYGCQKYRISKVEIILGKMETSCDEYQVTEEDTGFNLRSTLLTSCFIFFVIASAIALHDFCVHQDECPVFMWRYPVTHYFVGGFRDTSTTVESQCKGRV